MPAVKPIRPATAASVLLSFCTTTVVVGCDVDRLRVVLRDVDDLRVRRLDDDHLLAGRRGLRLDFLLRGGLQVPGIAGLCSQPLDAREHRRPIRGECLTEPGRRVQLAGHLVHDLRKEGQSHEARFEVVLQGGILQVGAFQGRVALQELVERLHAGGIRRAQEHLRQELVRIEGDGSEQAIEVVRGRGLTGRGLCVRAGLHDHAVPNHWSDPRQDQHRTDDEGELLHVQTAGPAMLVLAGCVPRRGLGETTGTHPNQGVPRLPSGRSAPSGRSCSRIPEGWGCASVRPNPAWHLLGGASAAA